MRFALFRVIADLFGMYRTTIVLLRIQQYIPLRRFAWYVPGSKAYVLSMLPQLGVDR